MEKKFMKGNEALAEAAVRAGVRFFAGYPITPQNEVPEYVSRVRARSLRSIWYTVQPAPVLGL